MKSMVAPKPILETFVTRYENGHVDVRTSAHHPSMGPHELTVLLIEALRLVVNPHGAPMSPPFAPLTPE